MSSKYLFGIVLLGLICGAISHSYVTSPISRSNQKQTTTGCRGPNCLGPCDVPVSQIKRAAIAVARGDSILIQWPRNNHAGGFIRFAWAPTAQSDSHSAFDSNVQQINCHEVGGCSPDSASDPNGGDTGPADGSSRACSSTLKVPAHLTDGKWTLQWAWFGGAYQLGDYYSCVDYQISGGASGSFTPVFVGGDYSYPNQQKCKYFNTDRLHRCVTEPCNNPVYSSGQRSGPPAFIQDGSAPVPVSPVPASTGVQTTTGVKAQTTGVRTTTGVKTQTTGVKTQTTGVKTTTGSRTTTGSNTQATTGVQTQATTGASCSDEVRCFNSTSTQRCFNNNLLAPQVCQTSLVCKVSASSKYAYCVRPTDTVRDDGTVDSAAALVHPTWIALALFAIFMML